MQKKISGVEKVEVVEQEEKVEVAEPVESETESKPTELDDGNQDAASTASAAGSSDEEKSITVKSREEEIAELLRKGALFMLYELDSKCLELTCRFSTIVVKLKAQHLSRTSQADHLFYNRLAERESSVRVLLDELYELAEGVYNEEEEKSRNKELPPDLLEIVEEALHDGPMEEVIVQKYNVDITRRHLQVLLPTVWLNDEVRTVDNPRSVGALDADNTCLFCRYLHDESEHKKKQKFDEEGWELVTCTPDTPQQNNGSDCGVFSCMFADYISQNKVRTAARQQSFRESTDLRLPLPDGHCSR
ncbi:unnamed protein product [Phytophthora fragariaefolia]|uniref:Unnamed protein product n=1 Tax=Phytophthora fragariaefolia TaxID=1490495 RepID=A0A9W6U2I5_9STRA|nr:unnamed protein product [Phytophthora fragariaefolia]